MKFHDARTDKPKKSGTYITCKIYRFDDGDEEVYAVTDLEYDRERDGWNITESPDRDTELFPHYWAEMLTVEDVIGNERSER